ncbi:MAG: serine/threonine-protein kinase [Verrucomicrobiota bacterium]
MGTGSDPNHETKLLPRIATGQQLKQFQLESILGEGGMGVVYRAYDSQLCRPVAVKVLPSHLTEDPDRKQRFLLEARAAARINHPAVAQIFNADEQDGTTFIVMELVEGKTLREHIDAADLDLLGIVEIGIQAADGLAKAHELGIVHRDIKPANVMVTREAHVKILDFGLAKLLDRGPGVAPGSSVLRSSAATGQSTLPGVVMGTAAYMSPEQVRGVAIDCRADIFSLGVLLFELLTGSSPFRRDNFMDSLHAIAFDEPPPLVSPRAHLPDELQRIVSRCLRKRPEERYPDARVLARDLRELRRNTEAGRTTRRDWRVRLSDAWEWLQHLRPSQYAWFGLGAAAVSYALFLSFSRVGTGGVVFLAFATLYLYRYVRNRPHKAQEAFVRRVARIPEVQIIVAQDRQFTVVVDRAVPQLYARINQHLQTCDRKLYFGERMTVSILQELGQEKTQQLLSGRGVQYVRKDVLRP